MIALLRCLRILWAAPWISDPKGAFVVSAAMFLQNAIYFLLWPILLESSGRIGPWSLDAVATAFGVGALAFGLTSLAAGGAFDLTACP